MDDIKKFYIPDWLKDRFTLLEDTFFKINSNITVQNKTQKNMFHRIVNETCLLSDIIDIDFAINKVAIISTSWTPQLLFNYQGIKFNISNKFWEGIVFDGDVILEVTRTIYNTFNPNYMTFIILPKNYDLDENYFNDDNPLIIYPIECKNAKSKIHTLTENSCIIDNNSNNTIITFIEGGVYFLPNCMNNTYYHPYAEVIANKLKCNVISFRYDNQNNYAPKLGLKGYPPLTYNNLETVDYIKTVLKTKLNKTKKLYTMSWCLGVYDALAVGEQLECNAVFTFDYFLSNINTSNVFYSYFEPDEKELNNKPIGKHVPIDSVIISDGQIGDINLSNTKLVDNNKNAKFKTITHSEILKPASNTLEMCLMNKYPFFKNYI